ncbi:MAG TPA: DHHA1 domain-containing protein [Chloroflexota bacterium]|nr:DHHA1 domain-containing protein [Chloroflexota bacterium]
MPTEQHTERLYYYDSNLLTFTGRVVEHAEVKGKPAVILDRTAFYPTSGGQPNDLGSLAGVPVQDVVDAEAIIYHVLGGALPAVGAEVEGVVDQPRRLDHTQQHSAQHTLSQAFEQVGGGRTVSFHLGAEATTIDLDVVPLSAEVVRAAEELANQVVLENREIRVHFARHDDLERFGLRKATERTGLIRIVEIDGFDRSACGGTHVGRTGEIGPIKVRRWERRGEVSRVEFLGGWRALRDYTQRWEATRGIAERLSIKDADVLSSVGRLLDDAGRLREEVETLRSRLLDFEVEALLAEAARLPDGETRLIAREFPDRVPDDLKRLALAVTRKARAVVLLGSTGARSHLIFAQTPGLPHDLNALLRQVGPLVGARGGGSRDLAQGGSPNGGAMEPALKAASFAISVEGVR